MTLSRIRSIINGISKSDRLIYPTPLGESEDLFPSSIRGIQPQIPNKKRASNNNSVRRGEIMKQYLGKSLKGGMFSTKAKPKPSFGKLYRSFHYQKPLTGLNAPTPQFTKFLTKKKVNNFFIDFVSPERSVKNPKLNKSKNSDFSKSKTRDNVSSPINFIKNFKPEPKIPTYKIFKSVSAVEACEEGKDVDFDEKKNIVTKFAFATRVGHSPSNPNKVNQDSFILAPNILNIQSMHYFGVCDGHGQNGKDVSSLVKQQLPSYLEEYLYSTKLNVKDSLKQSFLDCNKELMNNGKFDVYLSGTTC